MRTEWFTSSDLAGRPGMPTTPRGIEKKASRENWQFHEVPSPGRRGSRREYHLSALPRETRVALIVAENGKSSQHIIDSEAARAGAAAARKLIADQETAKDQQRQIREAGLAAFKKLPEAQQQTALARSEILDSLENFLKNAGFSENSKKGIKTFCKEVLDGRLSFSAAANQAITRKGRTSLSYNNLIRWRKSRDEHGLRGLAPRWKPHNKGQSQIPPTVQDFLVGMIVEHPHAKASTLHEMTKGRFNGQTPKEHVLRRFVERWKAENASVFLYLTNPDEWKNRHMFAIGRADEQVTRLNQVWELDSTPADVMLTDGRYAIIGLVDVYSRRAKLHVCPTSKASAIAAIVRRGIIDWGVPEVAKTDNGQDYVSNHLVRVFHDLEVEQDLCPPFSPEHKPHVERFFKTFLHGILELKPGYIGHNVADRKNIEARKSFAQRMMTRDETVELRMTAAELQTFADKWLKAVYEQNAHAGLNGATPAQIAREWSEPVRKIADVRALDMLLCEAPRDGGMRTIGKKGIGIDNRDYIAPEFAGYSGQRVHVLLDPLDLGRVFVYRETAQGREFLCTAVDPSIPQINRAEFAAKVKTEQDKIVKEKSRKLRRKAKAQALENVADEYLEYRAALRDNIVEMPHQTEDYSTPALDEFTRAADAADGLVDDGFSAIEVDVSAGNFEKQAPTNVIEMPAPFFADDVELYEYYRQAVKSRDLNDEEKARLSGAWQRSKSLRMLMEIEGKTLESFGI